MSSRETRAIHRKRELRDILSIVLDLGPDNDVIKFFKYHEYDQIHEVFHMEDMDIENGIWEDEEGNHKVLSRKKIQLIKRLRAWNAYMRHEKKTMGLSNLDIPWGDPTVINEDSFLEFTENIYMPKQTCKDFVLEQPSMVTSKPHHNSVNDLTHHFEKGIKRDKTHYKVLRDEDHYEEWRRGVISTAHAHGCEAIIDDTVKPTDRFSESEGFKLFQLKIPLCMMSS